jgi:hypothetical protein
MEIRRVVLTAVLMNGWSILCAASGEAIRTYPLDERIAYTVRVSQAEPTTCLFPGPITALESANVSTKADDTPPVLLSHQPGSNFFSVRALQPQAAAAVNVIHRGRIYVLSFRGGEAADRAVSFFEPVTGAVPTAMADGRSLLERARNHALLAEQYPALVQAVERATPGSVTRYPGFTVVLEEVLRYDPEDTLVFRARIENTGPAPIRYDPSDVAVRVGPTIYPATGTDAAGEVPPRAEATVWFAVTGGPGGGRANLSVRNSFSVLVPLLP